MATSGWEGLTYEELQRLVLEVAPPLHRYVRFNATSPALSGSKLVSDVWERLIEGEILAADSKRLGGAGSLSKQLRASTGWKPTLISALKLGRLDRRDKSVATTWARFRKTFEWLLLGNSVATGERKRLVEELTKYFFDHEHNKPPTFFALEALGKASPQSPAEGIYNVLWTADQVLRNQMHCCITAVSGLLPYLYVVNGAGELTEVGKCMVLAAAAGVRVVFAYLMPEYRDTTPAQNTAEQFLSSAKRFVETDEWPEAFRCVFDRVDNRQELRLRALRNIFVLGVPKADPAIVPGYFVPSARFASFRTYSAEKLEWKAFFITRATDCQPPMFELSSTEEDRFFDWCVKITLPVDPRETPSIEDAVPMLKPRKRRTKPY